MEYRVSCPACDIWGEVISSGDDCTIVIKGGSAPHIGSVCLAVPRPSLTGSGTSATVSVLNRTGHMDDSIACAVAKHVAATRNCAVACACGIHIDNASAEAIAHIQQAQADIIACVLDLLEATKPQDPAGQCDAERRSPTTQCDAEPQDLTTQRDAERQTICCNDSRTTENK